MVGFHHAHHPDDHTNIANVLSDTSERGQYLKSHEYELIKSFMAEIGFIEREEFFTDDIISDESLMKTFASLSYSWNIFSFLKNRTNEEVVCVYECAEKPTCKNWLQLRALSGN